MQLQQPLQLAQDAIDAFLEQLRNPIDILPYYTHEITNVGEVDSHTIMWISEIFNPNTSDTYREEVDKK